MWSCWVWVRGQRSRSEGTFSQVLAHAVCSPSDLYCTLEVDSFGFFSNKAKTRVYRYTSEPKWNEVSRVQTAGDGLLP